MKRTLWKITKWTGLAVITLSLAYFVTVPLMLLVLLGLWDVSRNRSLDLSILKLYFAGKGMGTWLASPFNILLDILALPFLNPGVYELSDLPRAYQDEINDLIKTARDSRLTERLEEYIGDAPRTMIFFKWYGRNVKTPFQVAEFLREYRFVRTIGVSAFRERENTKRHFGPFRPSLRVLYCLNDDVGEDAYIKVGPVENHWREHPLFIFDDTLLHQSFNETDAPRYCLWADIIRPSYVPFVFDQVMNLIRLIFQGANGIFYKNWKLIEGGLNR
ncbi:MAG: aspartyl/asparaginyl beta-hydroxylase domain-containing protein [Acidobacteria bacterium]|nr:aspartyl/asparaginyl beta-hydroxylase domain-containing protein [Acidobacteriota bacterium]